MRDRKAEALRRVPLFAYCGRKELIILMRCTDEVALGPNHTLIKQGNPADSFFLLLEGEAAVEVNGQPRPTLQAGDFFGEISMLDRGPATATVVTKTPARVMVMSHGQFREAIKANDALLSKVMAAMAERLRRDSFDRRPA